MAEELGERTEQPTSRRRGEARERGQIGKSTDLGGALILAGACVLVYNFAESILEMLALLIRHNLGAGALASSLSPMNVTSDVVVSFTAAAKVAAPLMLLMAAIAYATQLWQVGFILTTKPLELKLERLNFIQGFGRLFSTRSVVKGGLDLLKLVVIAAIVIAVVRSEFAGVVALASLDLGPGMMEALRIIVRVAMWVLAILVVLGIIDKTYQSWQVTQDLRMTKQEVKDEFRSSEGDVETKARRLKMARTMMMQRLQKDVPGADVIVTNPTHYAVALRYDAATMKAPKVVAKGADYLALKIRYIAAAHGVPILERPPLARALYAQVDVGREVNPENYEAVAEVLAYIYRLEGKMAG